jgi:UDP-3-O-[3-hydroxymyristoyl] glucosamine N-acyltransferase
MKFEKPYKLSEIAYILSCSYLGDGDLSLMGINEIHRVIAGDIVFVDHPKYYDKALHSNATAILIDKAVNCPPGKGLLLSDHPFEDFNTLTRHFSKAVVPQQPTLNQYENIYPGVYIGANVSIGKNVTLYPGVCVMDGTILEDNVVIGPNTTLGHNAFYYKKQVGKYHAMHSCGYVHIEKNVEIGAGCTIDRGVTDVTRIGEGTKIDNQVQIGHDTLIGKNCLFAAHVGIAGCVVIHDNVTLWGQVGVTSGITLGEGVTVLAQSGISKDLEAHKTYFGSPCGEAREKFKEMAALRQLPELIYKMK